MIYVLLLSLLLLAFTVAAIVYRHRFNPQLSNGHWFGGPLTNLASVFIGMILIALSALIFTGYRDDRRAEERVSLLQIAKVQEQIFKQTGTFGGRADIIARRPALFAEQFWVENGVDLNSSFLNTTRCQMFITIKRSYGPVCGSR